MTLRLYYVEMKEHYSPGKRILPLRQQLSSFYQWEFSVNSALSEHKVCCMEIINENTSAYLVRGKGGDAFISKKNNKVNAKSRLKSLKNRLSWCNIPKRT